jgi:hypothetical protein
MLLVYSVDITERLRYTVNTLLNDILGVDADITDNRTIFKEYQGVKINYSNEHLSNSFQIIPYSILFETDIKQQQTDCFETDFRFESQPVKAFFKTSSGDLPFDIFAASFYLLSRYEEYLPHQQDKYGRYAHTESLAFKEGFLHLPIVNIWLQELKNLLQQRFPELPIIPRSFKFLPTYDIDVAYAYKHKGTYRTFGGFIKAIFSGQWSGVKERLWVLMNKRPDPYDPYEWLDSLHLYCRLDPIFFFLVAEQQKGYDNNISTQSKAYRELIAYHAKGYEVGLHPSWRSNDDEKILQDEKVLLEVLTDVNIIRSRQHYLKFSLPQTFRRLLKAGIRQEYSMGYGSINGFRASVCSAYYWFDLEKNESTALRLFPFCFMDANAHFEQGYSPHQGYTELKQYYNCVRKLQGLFICIWHNNFLGQNPQLKGWREVYEIFLKEDVYWE